MLDTRFVLSDAGIVVPNSLSYANRLQLQNKTKHESSLINNINLTNLYAQSSFIIRIIRERLSLDYT